METKTHDIAIAGGGLSGVCAALRIGLLKPEAKILLLEKNSHLGGRALIPSLGAGPSFIGSCSDEFISFFSNLLSSLGFAWKKEWLSPLDEWGFLQGKKLSTLAAPTLLSEEGAKFLGGQGSKRSWGVLLELLENADPGLTLIKAWKEGAKHPLLQVCSLMAPLLGMCDLLKSEVGLLKEKFASLPKRLVLVRWHDVFESLLQDEAFQNISFALKADIAKAQFANEEWMLETSGGNFKSPTLIVAMSPWEALDWLDRKAMPIGILNQALKLRPTSYVQLSQPTHQPEIPPPPMSIIASEGSILCVSKGGFEAGALVPFETALDAPEVTKRIKSLRRSLIKMGSAEGLFPNGTPFSSHESIAMHSIGWCQPTTLSEIALLKGISFEDTFAPHLGFCGDAFGHSFDFNSNMIESIISVTERVKF